MTLAKITIGKVDVDFPVLLAPMAGYTDAAFRSIALEYGAGAVYTELTSAEGLRRDSVRTQELLIPGQNEHPIGGHIFGRDPESMALAARYIEEQGCFDFIDLNCGCPVKKVAGKGAGAALTKEPQRIYDILQAIRKKVSLPVTVKTRIGWGLDTATHVEIAKAVEEGGADLLTVHGRYATRMHNGPVHLDKLAEMKQAISIPLIGNGGIHTPADADEMFAQSGVDGVMIGRAAMGNPWIFKQFVRYHNDAPPFVPTLAERRAVIALHLRTMVENFARNDANDPSRNLRFTPEIAACKVFRVHLVKYVHGLRGRKALAARLNDLLSVDAMMSAVDELFELNAENEAE